MRDLRLWTAAAAAPAVAAGFSLLAGLRAATALYTRAAPATTPGSGSTTAAQPFPCSGPGSPSRRCFASPALLECPSHCLTRSGSAVKLPDTHGPSADQDLLLTSSIDRPLLRCLLFPATSFVHGAFSSALPYQFGDQRVVLLLVSVLPDGGGRPSHGAVRRRGGALAELEAAIAAGLQFQLRIAGSLRSSQPLATLTIGGPFPAEQTEQLRFNPWTRHPAIRLAQPAPRHRLLGKPTRPARSRPPLTRPMSFARSMSPGRLGAWPHPGDGAGPSGPSGPP